MGSLLVNKPRHLPIIVAIDGWVEYPTSPAHTRRQLSSVALTVDKQEVSTRPLFAQQRYRFGLVVHLPACLGSTWLSCAYNGVAGRAHYADTRGVCVSSGTT